MEADNLGLPMELFTFYDVKTSVELFSVCEDGEGAVPVLEVKVFRREVESEYIEAINHVFEEYSVSVGESDVYGMYFSIVGELSETVLDSESCGGEEGNGFSDGDSGKQVEYLADNMILVDG